LSKDLEIGDYSLNVPPTQENFWDLDSSRKALNKQLKKEIPKKKILAFVCYEYKYNHQNSDWGLCRDENMCDSDGSDNCILFPIQTLPYELVVIKDQLHTFFSDLLSSGWSAHCIKLKVESEPPSFDSSFDRELWSSCRVIFKYMDSIDDFGIVTTLSNILRLARENSYSSVLFLQNTEIPARKVLWTLSLLLEEIDDFGDTQPLSWFLGIVSKNLQLQNSDFALFDGNCFEELATKEQASPVTIGNKFL
jgi:hypothetical protein